MTLGPFLIRELRTSSRRRRTFSGRAASAAVVLAVLGCVHAVWSYQGWERSTVGGMARFTLEAFAAVVAIHALGAGGGVPNLVAPRIAGERERRTLDALLASRLSSAEIVLGTTAEGMAGYLSGLAAIVPIVLLMVPLGGIDPRLVLLAFGALLSLAFALAALAALASVGARDRREALSWAGALTFAWWAVPLTVIAAGPKFWPAGARWVVPAALVVLDSTPIAVLANLAGALRRCGPVEAVLRMIGLQLAGGTLLLLVAIAWLRPASRAAHDGETRTAWLLRTRPSRRRRWPACGDDPIFWRERHSRPAAQREGRIVGAILGLAFLGGLALGLYWFAGPAFREVAAHGYGAAAGLEDPDLTPLALALVRGRSGGPPTGQARVEFNAVLRQLTVALDMFYVLCLAGIATAGIARERAQDTWSALLATPLTGREIVRAKMLAAAWRVRATAAVLVALWTVGLLAGAVHPVGYALAIAGLGASTWFLAALGTACSLRAADLGEANNRVTLLAGALVFSGLIPAVLPPSGWPATVVLGAASAPLQAGLALVAYEDVREALRSGGFPALRVLGIRTGDGAWAVLATCLIGLAGQAIGALLLTRRAVAGFDACVGRPSRSGRPDFLANGRPGGEDA